MYRTHMRRSTLRECYVSFQAGTAIRAAVSLDRSSAFADVQRSAADRPLHVALPSLAMRRT